MIAQPLRRAKTRSHTLESSGNGGNKTSGRAEDAELRLIAKVVIAQL